MREWIYVLSNNGIPGMVKVGHNEDYPESLIRSFDLSGCSPFPYLLEYKVLISNDCFRILQNVRKTLLINQCNLSDGWCRAVGSEVISIIRHEIAAYILGKFKIEIQNGNGDYDLATLIRIIDSVIVLKEDYCSHSSVPNPEVKEIAMAVASILKDKDWMKNDEWDNKITGGKNRYSNPLVSN